MVVAVATAPHLNIIELWVAFSKMEEISFICAHEIVIALDPDRCIALSIFHAFTDCHSVSYFEDRGKRTAWNYLECLGK